MENKPFVIGQKVVCVAGIEEYKKGKLYTVKSMEECPICQKWLVEMEEGRPTFGTCSCCGKILFVGLRNGMAFSHRFAPIPPAYEDIRHELAKDSVEERLDQPVREIVNN